MDDYLYSSLQSPWWPREQGQVNWYLDLGSYRGECAGWATNYTPKPIPATFGSEFPGWRAKSAGRPPQDPVTTYLNGEGANPVTLA